MAVTLLVQELDSGVTRVFERIEDLVEARPDTRVWLDVWSEDPEVMARVAAHFGLHELTVEDCLTPGHAPKLEDFGTHLFLVLRSMKSFQELESLWAERQGEDEDGAERHEEEHFTRKVALYLSDRFIITYRRGEVSWLDALVRKASQAPEQLLAAGTDTVAHRVIDVLTDRFIRGLGFFERVLEEEEHTALEAPDRFSMSELLELKRELMVLKQIARVQRTVTAKLAGDPSLIIRKQQRRYFKDIDDHALDVINMIEKEVDTLHGIRDAYFTHANVRLGDTMRILAVITTLVAPLNVLVGVYGMNFDAMPLLHDRNGFWIVLVFLLGITVLMLLYFRRKRWL